MRAPITGINFFGIQTKSLFGSIVIDFGGLKQCGELGGDADDDEDE
jgi:hypothetical protein